MMRAVLKTTVLEIAAAVNEIGCDSIGTVSVFLVLKTVFLCNPGQGILEQTFIGNAFDQFEVVSRNLLSILPRWFGRSLILWNFWDLCCDGPKI